jgi:hypothetical protein
VQGKAFSGKTTQAKKIIEKLGAEKVTLFDMQEIVREAIESVDPNNSKREDGATPNEAKKGGKGGNKSALQDNSISTPSRELDLFKEVSSQILNQIQ